jgi:hypothetical protein
MEVYSGGYIMKKQYLIIGLAGLMACNAVSTSYCNGDDSANVALFTKMLAEKKSQEGKSWTRFLPSTKTVVGCGAAAIALAGGIYYLNHTGKLPKNMDSDAAKAFASKIGSVIGSKFSNLKSGVSNWFNSPKPVNKSVNKPVNNTLDTTKFCGLNKSQEFVFPKINSKSVINPSSLPKQTPDVSKTFGQVISNTINTQEKAFDKPKPMSNITHFIPSSPSASTSWVGSLWKSRMGVLSKVKENIGSLIKARVDVLSNVKKNIVSLRNNAKAKYANMTDEERIERLKNFAKKLRESV